MFPPTCIQQRKIKCCTFAYGAFRPNLAPMPLDNSLHGRQSDARSREIISILETLKGPKESRSAGAVDTSAAVANEKDVAPVDVRLYELATGGFTLLSEFLD